MFLPTKAGATLTDKCFRFIVYKDQASHYLQHRTNIQFPNSKCLFFNKMQLWPFKVSDLADNVLYIYISAHQTKDIKQD